jgi:alanine racemase
MLHQSPHLNFEGLMTHLASVDDPQSPQTDDQMRVFNKLLERLQNAHMAPPVIHTGCSAAVIRCVGAAGTMVRLGISVYGINPDPPCPRPVDLHPAMKLISKIVLIKDMPAGAKVGYGGTFVTSRASRIGIIPLGYGDGYPRSLSNKGMVTVRGRTCPVRGRVSMDQILIDLMEVPDAVVGDDVVIYSNNPPDLNSVESISPLAGTNTYELLCRVSARVARKAVD